MKTILLWLLVAVAVVVAGVWFGSTGTNVPWGSAYRFIPLPEPSQYQPKQTTLSINYTMEVYITKRRMIKFKPGMKSDYTFQYEPESKQLPLVWAKTTRILTIK